jgi:hypothetical protein
MVSATRNRAGQTIGPHLVRLRPALHLTQHAAQRLTPPPQMDGQHRRQTGQHLCNARRSGFFFPGRAECVFIFAHRPLNRSGNGRFFPYPANTITARYD